MPINNKFIDNSNNKETLNIMIKYGIVSGETVNNLIESGKIDSKVFADLDGEYKGSIE